MSALDNNACTLSEVNGEIQCSALPFASSLLVPPAAVSIPVTHIVPSTGPVGRTRFTITYQNFAEAALNSTRYNQIIGFVNNIYGSFASGLGHARDTSLASNAIDVKINVNCNSLSEAYQATILFGPAPGPLSDGYWQEECWRLRITKKKLSWCSGHGGSIFR